MKKYLLILFVPLAFWACSKKTDVVEPDLTTTLLGVYNQNYLKFDSIAPNASIRVFLEGAIPTKLSNGDQYSAFFTVRRDSSSVIYITLTEKQTGYTDDVSSVGQFKLRGASAPYDLVTTNTTLLPTFFTTNQKLVQTGTKVGTIDASNINLEYTYQFSNGGKYRWTYTARK
jgi:hypothetical protein